MRQANLDKSTYIEVPVQTLQTETARHHDTESNLSPKFQNYRNEKSSFFKSKIERVNIISKLNFLYVISVVVKCWKATKGGPALSDKDLVTFPYQDRGEIMEEKFLKHLQKQKKSNPSMRPSTALAVAMTIKWPFLTAVLIQILFGFMRVFAGWVIKRLIDCYMDPTLAQTHSYWWAGILAGILLFSFYFEHHWYHKINYICASLRSGLISMLYSKITRLSVDSITKISAGKLVNIAANDVNVFEMYGPYFPSVISGWFILIAAAALLWIYFGVTCLLGIGYLLALTPIQAIIAMLSVKPRVEKNSVTDERVRKTSEAIEGIRLLKMYTWELKFKEIIDNLRKTDVRLMQKVLYLGDVVSRSLSWSSQYIAGFLMFMLYRVTGGELTVAKVFSAYFILSFTRFYFSYFMANGFNFFAETRLLFKRFDEIMETAEMSDKLFEEPVDSENSVEFDKFTSYWSVNEDAKPTLIDLNLKLKKGSVNAIVGPVGASKTSFLLSFTGEMPKNTGSLRYKGKIAYVEQEPTIFAGTFRESILFGKEYNEEFYHKVIKACNLENDLKMFPNGDMSAIGERGNNLSGGQKARLALARAVYADANIYLLDDPLSAVDAKVAKSIFYETILGLLKGKTVILVTHQVHFVRDNENIIVMDTGRIAENGTYEELEARGIDVAKIFSASNTQEEQEEDEEPKPAVVQQNTTPGANNQENAAKHEAETLAQKLKENHGNNKVHAEENHANDVTTDAPLTISSNDDPYAGKVDLRTYYLLFKEVGWGLMFLIFISYILVQFGEVAFGRTLGAWVAGEFNLGESLGVVGGLSIYMLVMHYIKDSAYTFGFLGASRRYHKRMISKILRSPVGFFDANPVGRILNRFSNDIGVLDKFVPHVALDVFDIIALVLCVFITLAILDPALLGPIGFSVIIVGTLIKVYYPSIKQTKSYELATKGPVFNLLSSSISGIVIIRTFRQGEHFKHKFTSSLYKFTKGNINFILCSRSLGFWIDLFYYITAISMFYIIIARIDPQNSGDGVLAAFTLVLVMSLTGIFQHGVRQLCQTNVLMASAARVQAYCNLPEEAPVGLPKDQEYTAQGWPKKADIEFNNVYMKYKPDGHLVIKNLNLLAQSGQKIGCVGRTGAGKSTIINLLFRLQEIFKNEETGDGSITIDKANTQTMGLHLLRGNISIIPQIPFIFTGTVRQNVDPLGEFNEQQIWDVLDEVRLKEHVAKLPQKLDTRMNNASAVFSVGQKQLVCLARTILKPRKVLVLDEATANMDTETDNFIQRKVMEKFKDSTVFTIAHRLATIADYDKVLVLDKGQKMEFDAPYKLLVKSIGDGILTNPSGHFGSMVTNTGPHTSQRIVNIAKRAFEKKFKKESYIEMNM